jgi:hypothetical protein
VRRTRPLAVHDPVVIVGIFDIGSMHRGVIIEDSGKCMKS